MEHGGDFALVKPYINSKQNANVYVSKNYQTSLSVMKANMYATIALDDVPVLLRIKPVHGSSWPYEMANGHVLAANAIREDLNYIQMADPWMLYSGEGTSSFYRVESTQVHDVVTVDQYCGYLF